MLRFIELFSGIGGFRLGLEQTNKEKTNGEYSKLWSRDTKKGYSQYIKSKRASEGGASNSRSFKCIWSNDWIYGDFKWKKNKKTGKLEWKGTRNFSGRIYKKHWNDGTYVDKDIKTVNVDSIPDFDLLTAGFPCQSFSVAGKREGFKDTRGTLFYEICRIAEAKRPKLLFLENVKGLLSHDEGLTFQIILESLEELGYWCEWQVFNSKHQGVPQNRERVFIIGHLTGSSTREIFPIGQNDSRVNQSYETPPQTSPTIDKRVGASTHRSPYIVQIADYRSDEGLRIRKNQLSPTLATRKHSSTDISTMPPLVIPTLTPNRLNKRQLGRRFKEVGDPMFTLTGQNVHGVFILSHSPRTNNPNLGGSGVLLSKEHSFTIDSLPHKVIKDFRVRRITPVECERLQSFPDGWTEFGLDDKGKMVRMSDSQRYKTLGNAVTVNVIRFLGEKLLDCF